MRDKEKTKEQLVAELEEMRGRIARLGAQEEERKRAEESLAESEERYRLLFDNYGDPIAVWGMDGLLLLVNTTGAANMGGKPGDFLGRSMYELLPAMADVVMDRIRKIAKFGVGRSHEDKVELASGTRWFWSILQPVRNQGGDIYAVQVVSHDITDRKETEEALRHSEEHYRLLADNVSDVVWAVDLSLRPTYISPSIARLRGYTVEEAMCQPIEEALTPDSAAVAWRAIERSHASEELTPAERLKPLAAELEMTCQDGSTVWTETALGLLHDQDGTTLGYIGIARDITDRKQAVEELLESEARYRLLADNIMDAIICTDMNMWPTYVSPSITHLLGYSVEESMNRTALEALTPASLEVAAKALAKEMSAESRDGEEGFRRRVLELEFYRKDGSTIWVEATISFRLGLDGHPIEVMSVLRDVTDRKRAEERVRVAREYFQALVNSSLDMIISVDTDRIIVEFNRAAQETFGYSKEEAVGKCVDMLYADPSQGSRIHKAVRRTGRLTREILNKRKNGETFPCLLSTSVMQNAEGEFLGVMGVSRDITEQKMAEERLRDYYEQERELRQNLEAEIERRAQFT